VAAAGANCAGISEYGAKLACQTQNRRGCGTSLERALFKAASRDGNVFVQEVGEFGSGAYPRLVVWATLLTEDKMNELIAKGAILDGARRVGFRMLVFVDKGHAIPEVPGWPREDAQAGIQQGEATADKLPHSFLASPGHMVNVNSVSVKGLDGKFLTVVGRRWF